MNLLKNKKILIRISAILVIITILITTLLLILNKDNDNEVFMTSVDEKKTNQVGGFLTLMLETEAGSGTYEKSTSSSWPGDDYIFNENLSACENGSELSWNEELGAVNLKTNTSEKCYVYFDKRITLADVCNPDNNLSECIINYYNATGDMGNGLYHHDADLTNGAEDNSYRYAGANPNNYVCFGSDAATCPSDNLYRIIGVFGNEVKLIKNTSLGNYYWSGSSSNTSNTWSSSTLNTGTLNGTYLSGLGSTWSNKIATTSWKVGGIGYDAYRSPFNIAYDYEINNPNSDVETTYNSKIGLMYVSDYIYAAQPEDWNTTMGDYVYEDNANPNNNWMYINVHEWTISRDSDFTFVAFRVHSLGYLGDRDVNEAYAVRPVFYLTSFVQYFGGEGTLENPIRLSNNEIQFTIEGIQYTALEGMKWGDWISSEYNTSEYQQHCTNDYVSVDCRGITGVIDNTNSTSVTITDKIYSREYSHGGMHDPCSCVTLPEM